MQHKLYNRALRLIQSFLLLSLAMLFFAGCAASRANEETLVDGDSLNATGTDLSVPANANPKSMLLPAPIESVLPENGSFAALFVNVGKADASILRLGDSAVLIDTGSAESVPQLIAALNALKIEKISAVFITHSHSDHLGGLDALAANYDIPIVYSPYYSEANKDGEGRIVKRAEKLHLSHQELKAGESITLAEGATLSVLGPLSLNDINDNDNSLVLRFEYGGLSILFTGDMQFSEEQALLDAGTPLQSDILKVGNHGNPDATGEAFAAQVTPAVAVISTDTAVDEDSAHPRVLAALANANVFVTEDFPIGVLVTFGGEDQVAYSNPAKEMVSLDVAISVDVPNQAVTLMNRAEGTADLSGCVLFSAETGAALRFPAGTLLPAGGRLTVGSGNALSFSGDDSPLRKKKSNTVELFDSFGNLTGIWSD